MKLEHLSNNRISQMYDMRGSGHFPPRMTKADKQFMLKHGFCNEEGELTDHVLGYLLKLETAQLPNLVRNRRYTFLAVSSDGTACYVRDEWDRVILFWLMIDFPRCMFGI